MPEITDAPMTAGLRARRRPQGPALNRRYQAIGTTMRWIQDGNRQIELSQDNGGEYWAIPAPVPAALIARVKQAFAARTAAAG
jgi:hypothetical protein